MTRDWTETVHLDGSSTPLVITCGSLYISTTGPYERKYRLIDPGCRKCGHPSSVGDSCSTCSIWDNLERVVPMGLYIPMNKRTTSQDLELSKDLWEAKNSDPICSLLGTVLGVFAGHELPELVGCDVVTAVPSMNSPGHAVATAQAVCRVLPHRGFREHLVTKLGDTKMTGKSSPKRWEIAATEYQSGPESLEGGQTVLIVDDILTTGSTMEACAKILREKGASRVLGLVVARTV